ncbi:RICIN domain-containing protein [Streptomyces acidicola]|uniref:Ricin-type beta-trefoil lectin domain protein n=1 Tax=Streptomyces acidicola TaxID=2596892 RepID=A0A5N8WYB4_9ACTN|nr:RICIN domain-containing protein [Streptomyces acidicola]MPY52327.1 ricin-type beta-trefoil lectin domain protein [Streptomyces acidicola]
MSIGRTGEMRTPNRRSLRRAAGLTAASIAGAFSLGIAGASTAQAADVVNTFKNQATGNCLEGIEDGRARSYPCVGTSTQQWNVHQWADSTRELKNLKTGLCLDDSNAFGLRTFPCNATPFQSWYVKRWNDGTIEFKNQATGRCLDDSAAYGLRTFPCNATPYQSWY